MKKEKKRRDKGKKKIVPILFGLLLLLIAVILIQYRYTIKYVLVEGNSHYTKEEIENMVIKGKIDNYSIIVALKYRDKGIEDIPFIERIDVTVESNDTIKIKVYEKALAGCVQYLDRYLYFDKDGIIVESSNVAIPNVPLVAGLEFSHVSLYRKLPVENEDIFGAILQVTQLLIKHRVEIDKIYFDAKYNITFYIGEIRVLIGGEEFLEQKILTLKDIISNSDMQEIISSKEGGELDLRDYDENAIRFPFQPN